MYSVSSYTTTFNWQIYSRRLALCLWWRRWGELEQYLCVIQNKEDQNPVLYSLFIFFKGAKQVQQLILSVFSSNLSVPHTPLSCFYIFQTNNLALSLAPNCAYYANSHTCWRCISLCMTLILPLPEKNHISPPYMNTQGYQNNYISLWLLCGNISRSINPFMSL